MSTASTLSQNSIILKTTWIDTPLGSMIAIADERALYLLKFVDCCGLAREVERLRIKTKSTIIPGRSSPLNAIEQELKAYFSGNLKQFNTPLCLLGSFFQKTVWNALQEIPFGETRSYAQLAASIRQPSAYRAVANANAANQMAIVIPCHRVINKSGELGGYAGGVARKEELLNLENKVILDTF